MCLFWTSQAPFSLTHIGTHFPFEICPPAQSQPKKGNHLTEGKAKKDSPSFPHTRIPTNRRPRHSHKKAPFCPIANLFSHTQCTHIHTHRQREREAQTSVWPSIAAKCKGVRLSLSTAFTSAPKWDSAATTCEKVRGREAKERERVRVRWAHTHTGRVRTTRGGRVRVVGKVGPHKAYPFCSRPQ